MGEDSLPPSLQKNEKTELQGLQFPVCLWLQPKPAGQQAASSSFPTAQSGCSIIHLLETQPSAALLCRGLM